MEDGMEQIQQQAAQGEKPRRKTGPAGGGNKRYVGDGKGRQGGRRPGSPNKVNAVLKAKLVAFMEEHFEEFEASFNAITDYERKCQVYASILPYVMPKMASVEYQDKSPGKTFKDELDELARIKDK